MLLGELIELRKTDRLRQLAREYGVSHETIRKAVETANKVFIRVLGGDRRKSNYTLNKNL